MRKIDPNLIPNAPGEIRLFMVIRNESLRLPYLFKYYLQMGVTELSLFNGYYA